MMKNKSLLGESSPLPVSAIEFNVSDQIPSDSLQSPATSRPAPGLPVRRTLDNLAWALVALVLGWLAQDFFAREWLLEGLLLYAVAIPLFAVSLDKVFRREPGVRGQPSATIQLRTRPGVAPGIRGRVGVALAAAAVMLSFASLQLFFLETQNIMAWSLYAGSLLFFVLGVWLSGPTAGGVLAATSRAWPRRLVAAFPRSLVPSRPGLVLIAILALALFLRLFHFFSLPFGTWFDEAEAGIQARHLIQDPAFRPVFWEPINLPAHLLYLFSFSFRLFGVSTPALRVIPVLFGLGTVLFAYLFGREWKGWRWGLLLAFLVATMRWHVNFSRIAMTGIDTPFFEFATLYFGQRALRSGRLRPLAWSGLSLGLGLCFYGAFRLFVVALILLAVWIVVAGRRQQSLSIRAALSRLASPLGMLLVAAWLAVMPVAQFAWRHPDTFSSRTRMVSIFENRDEPSLVRALARNVQKHLLMFNYRGDQNGRHNLPGAPTLDRLSAILFAMGLGLAVARRDSAGRLFLLLLSMGLLGGILSLDFEAPQSLRSIAALPAVVYFIALCLDTLWLEFRWAVHVTRARFSLIPVALVLGVIAISNGVTYFGRQAHDSGVWRAFSTAETLVGKRMAEMGAGPVYYLSPFFLDHPSIRFHAPAEASGGELRKVVALPDPLPAREPPDRPVAYFLHSDEAWVFDLARQVYLSGWFEAMPADLDFPPSVYFIRLEPEDVASVQGLDLRYWAGDDWEGESPPVSTGRTPLVDVTWPGEAPLELPFVAEWDGVLYVPSYGRYTLMVEAPGRVELSLGGETIEGSEAISLTRMLAEGNHSLRLRAAGGKGPVRLSWQFPGGAPAAPEAEPGIVPQWALYSFPVSGHGLLGKYYANPNWEGAPALERVDPVLNVYFHLTPLPRPYSVEWSGVLDVPYDGVYGLGLRSVDESRLYLDGQLLLEATVPDETLETTVTLKAGLHDLRISYQDKTGRSRIHLYWTRPGGEIEILPALYLWPERASARTSLSAGAPSEPPGVPPAESFQDMDLAWQATLGEPGRAEGQFLEPRDVAVIGDMLFVADTGNRRVQALGRNGTFRDAWSGGEEPFVEPLSLGVDGSRRLLVLDSLPGWIYRFEASGEALDRFAGPSSLTFHPRAISVLPDGTVIVADTGGARLVFFGPQGNMAGRLGTLGAAPGQFMEPVDVAVDGAGTYYVSEATNPRIQRLDRWGNSLGEWPIPLSVAYDGPHLAWAPDGSLLMTDPAQGAILRYTPDGKLLNRWTQVGPALMRQPVGITVDAPTSTLYVTDTQTHQVHVFRIQ